jgi:hypothetical protein
MCITADVLLTVATNLYEELHISATAYAGVCNL